MLVLAVALVALAGARAQLCGADIKGSQTNLAIQMANVTLTPGIRNWKITLKKPTDPPICPPQTEHVGTELAACDGDSPPVVTLNNLVEGTVERTGDLSGPAVALPVLYCRFIYSPLKYSQKESGVNYRVAAFA